MNLETPQLSSSYAYVTATNTANISQSLINPFQAQANVLDLAQNSSFNNAYKEETKTSEKLPMSKGRIVRVFIVDQNENIPLTKCFIHNSEELLTELEDKELFFDLNIKEKLETYNQYRITVRDKKLSEKMGKDVMLEPVRIKDLNMLVVTIAQF